MTSIARYHALDMLRKSSIREDNEDSFDEIPPRAGVSDYIDPATILGDSENIESCLGQLEQLPRECIVQAYVEGMSHEELSDKYEKPLGTVKSWIRRGLLSLRECMNELS